MELQQAPVKGKIYWDLAEAEQMGMRVCSQGNCATLAEHPQAACQGWCTHTHSAPSFYSTSPALQALSCLSFHVQTAPTQQVILTEKPLSCLYPAQMDPEGTEPQSKTRPKDRPHQGCTEKSMRSRDKHQTTHLPPASTGTECIFQKGRGFSLRYIQQT